MQIPQDQSADVRTLLQQEFKRRTDFNPRYSLRAFASHLELDPSYLSKILRGERSPNSDLTTALAKKLGLSTREIETLHLSKIESKHGLKFQLGEELNFVSLSAEQLEIISDWNHYAILELIKLKDFKPDTRWIAAKIGLEPSVTKENIERLKRLGLLSVGAKGRWTDTSGGFSTHVIGKNFTSFAHKKSQEKVLQASLLALNDVPIEERDHSSMMMATSYEKISEAKEMIKKFRRELCAFLEEAHEKDAVFQLGVSLFPITKKTKGRSL